LGQADNKVRYRKWRKNIPDMSQVETFRQKQKWWF